jgi:hypothetical protein
MIDTGLPEPGIGKNPPRYRRMVGPPWKIAGVVGIAVAAFLLAGGIYYVFNINPTPVVEGSSVVTTGQGVAPRAE